MKPLQFLREVRHETDKVTWPTRKEVLVTTVAVTIMVALASVFFLIVDQVISGVVQFLLSLNG